jgi:hypothetical protein
MAVVPRGEKQLSERAVEIAGKTYGLRYLLNDRAEIERLCDGHHLLDVLTSGRIEYQAVLVWAGLRHTNRKLTPRAVLELLQKHLDRGGQFFEDVVKVAMKAAVVDGHLIGAMDEAAFTRTFFPGDADEQAGKEDEGGSVRAAE